LGVNQMAECFAWCWSSKNESSNGVPAFDPSQKPRIATLTAEAGMRKVPSRDTLHSPDLSPRLRRNESDFAAKHRPNGTRLSPLQEASPGEKLQNGASPGEKLQNGTKVPPPAPKPQSFCFPPPEPPPPRPAPAPLLNELEGLPQDAKDRELYDAAWDGDESRCEYLLAVGASPCSTFTRRKLTAVMACARAGNERILDKLLTAAPQAVNVQSRDGDTALHKAFEERRIKAAGLLLRAGGDPHIKNEDGVSAMGVARFRCPEEYQEMVPRYGECKDDLKLVTPSTEARDQEEIDKYNKN